MITTNQKPAENKKFNELIKKRYPHDKDFIIKWYLVDEVLKKHQEVEPAYDITNPSNQIGDRLVEAIKFIQEKRFIQAGGFEPPLINNNGNVIDGRHRLLALKILGYSHIPVEEYKGKK